MPPVSPIVPTGSGFKADLSTAPPGFGASSNGSSFPFGDTTPTTWLATDFLSAGFPRPEERLLRSGTGERPAKEAQGRKSGRGRSVWTLFIGEISATRNTARTTKPQPSMPVIALDDMALHILRQTINPTPSLRYQPQQQQQWWFNAGLLYPKIYCVFRSKAGL